MAIRQFKLDVNNSGILQSAGSPATWSDARNGAGVVAEATFPTGGYYGGPMWIYWHASLKKVGRLALTFDTSSLPADAVITRAAIKVAIALGYTQEEYDSLGMAGYLVEGNHNSPIQDSDFQSMLSQVTSDPTEITQAELSLSSPPTSDQLLVVDLSDEALGWVVPAGVTKFGVRPKCDLDNADPGQELLNSNVGLYNYSSAGNNISTDGYYSESVERRSAEVYGKAFGKGAWALEVEYTSETEDPDTVVPAYRWNYGLYPGSLNMYTDWVRDAYGFSAAGDLFEGTLTGLEPDQTYQYRLQSDTNNGGTLYLHTSDAPPDPPSLALEVALGQSVFSDPDTAEWTDISEALMAYQFRRGRKHELDKVEAGKAVFELDNSDGRFWRNNDDSDLYPYFKPLTLCRLKAIYDTVYTYPRFYGVLESVPHKWKQQAGFSPYAEVTAVDMFKSIAGCMLKGLGGTVGSWSDAGALTEDASSGTATVKVKTLYDSETEGCDLSRVKVGQTILIGDDNNVETNVVAAVTLDDEDYGLTLENNLANDYLTADHAFIRKFPAALSSVRMNDIILEIGWPAALTDIQTGLVTVAALQTPTGGTNALDHMHDVAAAESGSVLIADDGTLTFHNRDYRRSLNSSATFLDDGDDSQYADIAPTDDDDYIFNEARISSPTLQEQAVVDGEAQLLQGQRAWIEESSAISSPNDAFDKAYLTVKRYVDSAVRPMSLTVRPAASGEDLYPKALGYDIPTRLTVQLDSDTNPAKIGPDEAENLGEAHIESIEESWNPNDGITTVWGLWDVNQYMVFWANHTGYLGKTNQYPDTYGDCHDAATADEVHNDTDGLSQNVIRAGQANFWTISNDDDFDIWRGLLEFDTNDLGEDDVIDEAQVILYVGQPRKVTADFNLCLVGAGSVDTPVEAADYNTLMGQTTVLGEVAFATPAINSGWVVIPLNASGIAAIIWGDYTRFGLRSSNDISETSPGTGEKKQEWVEVRNSNTDYKPRLVVRLRKAGGNA